MTTFFSKKGKRSTWFERTLFLSFLVGSTLAIVPGVIETLEVNRVFSKADPSVIERCRASASYNPWTFWNTGVAKYSTCIVNSKDPDVQNAAGKYILKGGDGEITIAPEGSSNQKSTDTPVKP
jgi:hypothetical protein